MILGALDLNIGVTIFLKIIKNQNLEYCSIWWGAKNAVFPKEEISRQYAGYYLNKIWKVGSYLGYGNYFKKKIAPPLLTIILILIN